MKSFASQLTYLLSERETRSNLRAFAKYLIALAATVGVYSVLFHVIMLHAEGQHHSWLTGVYWTLTVMSTLGFGDITFHSDLGRFFSIVVLLSGVFLLLIVLPFAFIRYFYAPWLEAQIRLRAPRKVPDTTENHVLICHDDEIGRGLSRRLSSLNVPFFFVEADATSAANLHAEGLPTVIGELDNRDTYAALRAEHARMVVVNVDDITNTNITLTVREVSHDTTIVALAEDQNSIDILELSGANHVLPLKHRLGQQLASRVAAGAPASRVVGRFESLLISEFPAYRSPFANRKLRETGIRELTGLNVVAYWERGRLLPAAPDTVMSENAVAVLVGTESQVEELNAMMAIYEPNEYPVVVIGGGKVGCACARALKERDIKVHLIERDAGLMPNLSDLVDKIFIGDAAALEVVTQAGIAKAPSVVLTTNSDATNIYLAVYCRRLNPSIHIVSRVTHERNLEAVHRAGANIALSYGSVGVQHVMSLLLNRELVMLGEGVDLVVVDVPKCLYGRTLAESGIGAKTGLNVIGVQGKNGVTRQAGAGIPLEIGDRLVAIGASEQRLLFEKVFVKHGNRG